jgi:uncharacterized Ntn-hydrolase superfamily protein
MPTPSTFSFAAYDPDEIAWGVAVASKFPAVGNIVPWAKAKAGAIATQSHANTSYGPNGISMLETGKSAQDTLEALISEDSHRESRQVGIVDSRGGTATFTGKSCADWAGGYAGNGFAVQGNILVGEQVIQAMARAYENSSRSIMWRLHGALLAGDKAGGDRRGRQSAAIYIVKPHGGYGGFNDRWVDYRVDDHPDPVRKLAELLELHDLFFDTSPEKDKIQLIGDPLIKLQKIMTDRGYYKMPINGIYNVETKKSLRAFIGNENFEERTDFETGTIDGPVYDYIINQFGDTA